MKYRTVIVTVAIAVASVWDALSGASAALGAEASASPRRPNFLFVLTDDQRWDAMGVVQREQGEQARFPWLRTPNMDRVAAEGVRFRNAFVVNSLCSPSRACFLTGRYNHLNGIANNRTPFPLDSITHATLLRQAGYKTGYFGKWHMGEEQHGQRPGFDVSVSFIGQGIYPDCPIEVNGQPTPSKGWVDDVTTDHALKFIEENKNQPFDMVVGFKSSHTPCLPPERDKALYEGEKAKPPANANAHPPYPIQNTEIAEQSNYADVPRFLNYFRTINGADDNLGRLLKALDDNKLADDTVVIFASDQSYFIGEHGLRDKRSAYEESIRMALLVRYPRLAKAGAIVDEMALNIDLAPTILDLAGVAIPSDIQGRSWKSLLEGKTQSWRQAFFYEYFFEVNHPETPTINAVRTTDAKLVTYPDHKEWVELFDLKNDPLEMKNLAADPAAKDLLARMQGELDQQAKAVAYQLPAFADPLDMEPPPNTKAGRERAKAKAATQGGQTTAPTTRRQRNRPRNP